MHDNTETPPIGYTIHLSLAGGFAGIGSRVIGAVPRRLRRGELARLRQVLAAGGIIEVVTASRETWEAMRPALLSQIGLPR
jgi:hypothetical protein